MAICSASAASASASAASAASASAAAAAAASASASAASASAAAASSSMALTHPTSFVSSLTCKPTGPALLLPLPPRQPGAALAIAASGIAADAGPPGGAALSKRSLMTMMTMAALGLTAAAAAPAPALADIEEDYKKETQEVITQVRATLTLDKADPGRGDAVRALRDSSNQWVAKYRREKRFAGKPSYSNIYSVLNAVSGHYISYGDGAPLPAKRKTQILEEVETAEKALNRGR